MRVIRVSVLVLVLATASEVLAQTAQLTVTAVNKLKIGAQSETIELRPRRLRRSAKRI